MIQETIHTDFSFFPEDNQVSLKSTDVERVLTIMDANPTLTTSLLHELWRTNRYDDLYEIGSQRNHLLEDESLMEDIATTVIVGCIGDIDRADMFSEFVLETAESLQRGAIELPYGPLSESDQRKIEEYHDEAMDSADFNLYHYRPPVPYMPKIHANSQN